MAEVKWIKIVTDIFDDEKVLLIESMPESDSIIVCWFKLLCLAGKQNNSGVFMLNDRIAYTDEMLATIFRRPVNTVRMALNVFESFGMIELINGVITIPNWDKHQSLDAYEKKKARDRLYQAERRAAQKMLAKKSSDSSPDIAVSEEDIEEEKDKNKILANASKGREADFDLFWSSYPKKVGKADAKKAFAKVKEPVDKLISAVEQQKKSDQWTKENGRFIPNPATWLNRGSWDDELPQSVMGYNGKIVAVDAKAREEETSAELEYLKRRYNL